MDGDEARTPLDEAPPLEVAKAFGEAGEDDTVTGRYEDGVRRVGRDGRRTQSILDAMYRSAYEADGGWVPVEPELA